MLMEDAIFNTKYHLLSLQEFIRKDICQALHCLRNFRDHFGKETIFSHDGEMFRRRNVFSHTMGRCFEEEMYYVASFISYFLEWGY